ncbi:TIGR02391 family protein [Gordonia sp. N1V]|uniref:TIGR02391 family protein n=1 Tax=Gordonia sp. N1V TaxID=3034163 RepID=UPI0023E1F42C|nr:TIGR02391 family protein [Gordonia sp. N1V]MDF3283240.1 TIGR02391 family protein [Gordonia sp. N1V]
MKEVDMADNVESAAQPSGLPQLHRLIVSSSGALFANGHYDEAVFKAYRAVEDRVKRLSGKSEIGKRLMTYVFNENAPTLDVISPNADEDQGADEREGFKFLFMGSAQGLRNPRGHGGDLDTPEDEAVEMLALASLLMRALDRAEEQQLRQPPEPDTAGEWDGDTDVEDDETGILDLIAIAEDAMPKLSATIEEMAVCLTKIGTIATEYTPTMNEASQSTSMAARLAVVNSLATELSSPTGRFRELAADYVGQMVDLNGGIDALIHMKPFAEMSMEDQAEYLVLAESVRNLRDGSIAGVGGAATLSQQLRDVAKLSRSLKKPSADLRDGVQQMKSVQHYYDEWVEGFRAAGI